MKPQPRVDGSVGAARGDVDDVCARHGEGVGVLSRVRCVTVFGLANCDFPLVNKGLNRW